MHPPEVAAGALECGCSFTQQESPSQWRVMRAIFFSVSMQTIPIRSRSFNGYDLNYDRACSKSWRVNSIKRSGTLMAERSISHAFTS